MEKLPFSFLGIEATYEEADIVIFGAPFDGTVTFRPGSRFGPSAMRQDFDGIESYSPYIDADIEAYKIHDAGDIDIPFGNKHRALDMIYEETKQILNDGKKSLMLGGEHLVTYSPIRCFAEKYEDLHIIHFDAHTDLREDYMGEKFSHATVMKRAWEIVGDNRIYQYGIRSGLKKEFEWAKEHTCLTKFTTAGVEKLKEKLKNKPVYITIDLDILDPSVFSGTGTPEPGGIMFHELLEAIISLNGLHIVGADIVELAPHYDQSGVSTAVACKIMRELLLTMLV